MITPCVVGGESFGCAWRTPDRRIVAAIVVEESCVAKKATEAPITGRQRWGNAAAAPFTGGKRMVQQLLSTKGKIAAAIL